MFDLTSAAPRGAVRNRRQLLHRIATWAWLTACYAGAISPYSTASEGEKATHPNIVLILADDLGYAELGCQGATDVRTPHIDSIARHGVRLVGR